MSKCMALTVMLLMCACGSATDAFGMVHGDFDNDGDVDLSDYGVFVDCYNGPGNPPKSGLWTTAMPVIGDSSPDGDYDGSPSVTADGVGHWVAVWSSNRNLGGSIGTDLDIFMSLSVDDGVTWTAPALLNGDAKSDSKDDESPEIATDGAGHWVAVWARELSFFADDDILVARSTDNGVTWTAPALLYDRAPTAYGQNLAPQIATDGVGNWVAVWESEDSLSGTIGSDWDILVSRSVDNGATWTEAAPLNNDAASILLGNEDRHPQIATDGAGHWVAVWQSRDDPDEPMGTDGDIVVARSEDNGATWTAVAALNSDATSDSDSDDDPVVTTDGAGNWLAVWVGVDPAQPFQEDPDILVSRSTDNGATWSAAAALNSNAATVNVLDVHPQVTTDGAGNWVAVWQSDDSLGGTIGADYDILVAWSADNGVTWTTATTLNSSAASDGTYDYDQRPEVTTDGAGNWVAIWTWYDGPNGMEHDVFVSRFVPTPDADFDDDGDVDLSDYVVFLDCYNGAGKPAACQ